MRRISRLRDIAGLRTAGGGKSRALRMEGGGTSQACEQQAEEHRNCWDYKIASTCFFGPIFPNLFQFSLCANNSSTCDMHISRVLPVLSLLLGVRASPVDSSDEASHRFHARADPSDVCFPTSLGGVASGVDGQTGGSTFSSLVHARVCF